MLVLNCTLSNTKTLKNLHGFTHKYKNTIFNTREFLKGLSLLVACLFLPTALLCNIIYTFCMTAV